MKTYPLPIQGLHHNAYRCRDAEETRAFYEDFLGLPLACSLRREQTETGVKTPLLHIFFEMLDGSYLAFFDLPEVPFDFKEQEPSDLHIALEVDPGTLQAMYDRGAAAGITPFGPVQLEVLKSIYFRDPNGYIVEFTTKTAGYKKGMDPDQNRAREILDRWEADKSVTNRPHGANHRQNDGAAGGNQKPQGEWNALAVQEKEWS